MCNEYRVECSDKWYKHSPKSAEENEEVTVLRDFTIQTDCEINHMRPDVVIEKKKAKETIDIVDMVPEIVTLAVPFKSKLTVCCESRFSTLDSCENRVSRIENLLSRIENF